MLKDLLENLGEFLAHSERFTISLMFTAVYSVRLLTQLNHPTMVGFYNLWGNMTYYFQAGTQ
ncbi:hypothetical protein F5X99DRAFT_412371 [Biscogniauxia marginata]|nr:hypothetical protein F5X99DRAFT_412371 [Biscogniauxia marginata]